MFVIYSQTFQKQLHVCRERLRIIKCDNILTFGEFEESVWKFFVLFLQFISLKLLPDIV